MEIAENEREEGDTDDHSEDGRGKLTFARWVRNLRSCDESDHARAGNE